MHVCACACVSVCEGHMYVGTVRGQKKVLDSLDLGLEVVVSLLICVLRIKPRLCARAVHPLSC